MNWQKNLKLFAGSSLWLLFAAEQVLAQTHSWVDQSRSSLQKNVFVSQSVEGEYGRFEKHLTDASPENRIVNQTWRGHGIQNGLGLEVFKFAQISLSHTLLNLRSKESSLENINGSRLSTGVTFVFSAPIGNLEFGSGVNTALLNYHNLEKTSTFVGSGHHYSVGMNYFLSPSISAFSTARRSEAWYKNNGGHASVEKINSKYDSLGLGFRVWF